MDEPTDADRERVYAWLRAHPYGEQGENGVDLSLLRENLKLTPLERLRKLERALRHFHVTQRAGSWPEHRDAL